MSLLDSIDKNNIPEHVSIIMDGNGRWAKKKGAMRIFGHQNAVTAIRQSIEAAAKSGVKFLSLYAFSTENWNRPKDEVDGLMELLVSVLRSEVKDLNKNNIILQTIGNTSDLPAKAQKQLQESIDITKNNTGLTVIVALSYSGKWDILNAAKKMLEDGISADKVDEKLFNQYLSTNKFPDPELLIRTSGEFRISNFMLWQLAYTEIHITETLWPDFREDDFYNALLDFQKRERRFGKTGDQISK